VNVSREVLLKKVGQLVVPEIKPLNQYPNFNHHHVNPKLTHEHIRPGFPPAQDLLEHPFTRATFWNMFLHILPSHSWQRCQRSLQSRQQAHLWKPRRYEEWTELAHPPDLSFYGEILASDK
jgi:hypothetical protein